MDQPTEDEVLAARTADALFGDAALDLAALKRAYAALVRRFRPESSPTVFAHVHALFNTAREALEGRDVAPDAPQSTRPTFPPVGEPRTADPPSPPVPEALASWVAADPRARDTPWVWAVLRTRLNTAPWTDDVDTCEVFLDALHVSTHVSDDLREALHEQAAWRLAAARARLDPDVPAALLAVVEACFTTADRVARARALAAYGASLDDVEAARLQRLLERRHPTVLSQLRHAVAMVQRFAGAERADEALKQAGLRPEELAKVDSALRRWELARSQPPLVALGGVGGGLAVLLSDVGPGLEASISVVLLGLVLLVVGTLVALAIGEPLRRLARSVVDRWVGPARRRTLDTLGSLARARGLFPGELVLLLCTGSRGRGERPPQDDPARWFSLDELNTLRWLGDAHVARVAREQAEGQA